jgi:hypothetical protein
MTKPRAREDNGRMWAVVQSDPPQVMIWRLANGGLAEPLQADCR